jgi:predicted RNA-binding protein associated with RNAse of E/G family
MGSRGGVCVSWNSANSERRSLAGQISENVFEAAYIVWHAYNCVMENRRGNTEGARVLFHKGIEAVFGSCYR